MTETSAAMKQGVLFIVLATFLPVLGSCSREEIAQSVDRAKEVTAQVVDAASQTKAAQEALALLANLDAELEAIKTGPQAEAARAKLAILAVQVEQGMAKVKELGPWLDEALKQSGLKIDEALARIRAEIDALLQNEQVKAHLEPVLVKLRAALGG